MSIFRLACFFVVPCAASAVAQLPELRDLDLTGWEIHPALKIEDLGTE